MKAKDYDVLVRAVEDGAAFGVRRFFKHRDQPEDIDETALVDAVVKAVVDEVDAWFNFDPVSDE
jgi:hypothetical protein